MLNYIMMEESSEKSIKGQVHQDYEVLQVVGSGTFGKVYKVRDRKTGALLAIKHVKQEKKFKNRELDILKAINSEFVVKLHNHFYREENNTTYLYLVMELFPTSLSHVINEHTKDFLSPEIVKRYTKCLLQGLKDIHALGICHRDIKPSNILVDGDKVAKFCDFGSAKILINTEKNVSYICSRYYRAPQLMMGAIYYSPKIDIWSLGCVISELLTNRTLFPGSDMSTILIKVIRTLGPPSKQDLFAMRVDSKQHINVDVKIETLQERLLRHNPQIGKDLIELISRMVVFNPDKRISASEALNLPLFKE